MATEDYHIVKGYVVSNGREIATAENGVSYIPVYFTMFLGRQPDPMTPIYI